MNSMQASQSRSHKLSSNALRHTFLFLAFLGTGLTCQSGDFLYAVTNGMVTLTKYTGTGGAVIAPDAIFGRPVTTIGDYLFANHKELGQIRIGTNVTVIGAEAFRGCSGLTNVVLPDGLTSLGETAFSGCGGLVNIHFPNYLESIGDQAFQSCTGLTNVNLPDSLTSIGIYSFNSCTGLKSITLPNQLTHISSWAFAGCNGLTSVAIPESVTFIGTGIFENCQGLTNITVAESNPIYRDQDGVLFSREPNTLLQFPYGRTGIYNVPPGVTAIQAHAFTDCTGLTKIVLPDSITQIEPYTFAGCTGLTGVVLPDSITTLGICAFAGCTGMHSILLSTNLSEMHSYAFDSCSGLTSITLPATVGFLDTCEFVNCTRLTSLYFLGNAPGVMPISTGMDGHQGHVFKNAPISVVYYQAGMAFWDRTFSDFPTVACTRFADYLYIRQTLPADTNSILLTKYTGYDTNLTIPEKLDGLVVAGIGNDTFNGDARLTHVTVPDTVKSIGDRAFLGCAALQSISLPDSLVSIGSEAFSYCGTMTNMTVPKNVSSLGDKAFLACQSLTDIYFEGNAPKLLGDSLFGGTYSNNLYYLPDAIGWGSVYGGCKTTVSIPEPLYHQWAIDSGLTEKYPNACTELDDADLDGMNNLQEMWAGTDPTDPNSRLAFEPAARPEALSEADQTAIGADQFALYFQTIPGKSYDLQSYDKIGDNWTTLTHITATTAQKRVLVNRPLRNAFYRIIMMK